MKRLCAKLKDDLAVTQIELEERDRLITEKGLVIVGEELPPSEDGTIQPPKKALVSVDNAQLLNSAGDGSLGKKLVLSWILKHFFVLNIEMLISKYIFKDIHIE